MHALQNSTNPVLGVKKKTSSSQIFETIARITEEIIFMESVSERHCRSNCFSKYPLRALPSIIKRSKSGKKNLQKCVLLVYVLKCFRYESNFGQLVNTVTKNLRLKKAGKVDTLYRPRTALKCCHNLRRNT